MAKCNVFYSFVWFGSTLLWTCVEFWCRIYAEIKKMLNDSQSFKHHCTCQGFTMQNRQTHKTICMFLLLADIGWFF